MITSIDKDVEKSKPASTATGNVKWCSNCGKESGGASRVKQSFYVAQQFGSQVNTQKK